MEDARSLALGRRGTLFVGSRSAGNVYALVDTDGDHSIEKKYIIASGLIMPNGVAFLGESLYVAEISRIIRFDDIENRLQNPPEPVVINDSLPADRHHGWKFIGFGPDGYLYVPIGAPCNICESDDPRYASITRMRPDGRGFGIYARGIRNTVGFDWHPRTGELYFTENGRDWMGNNAPPDELNHAPSRGMHFGYPYCHGKNLPDPELGKKHACSEFTPPELEIPAHVAALGMRFYTGTMFPAQYRNQIFIAEHGSWNRWPPTGYRVSLVRLKDGKPVSYEVFASGWLRGVKAWGRPVDIELLPDGSMAVSDDRAGAVYRIWYAK